MPNVTAVPVSERDEDAIQQRTYFIGLAGTVSTNYTYPTAQDSLSIKNRSDTDSITVTVNGVGYTIAKGNSQIISGSFTTFDITSTANSQSFDAAATKSMVENPIKSNFKNKFVLYGESTSQQNGQGDYVVESGLPNTYIRYARGYFTCANVLLRQRMHLIANHGVSGERSDQTLARINNVINANPDYVIVLSGANDAVQGKLSTFTIQNLKSIYDILTNRGITVIACTVLPNNTVTAAQMLEIVKVNNWIKKYSYESSNLIMCDFFKAVATKAGDAFDTNMHDDGTHYSVQGAMNMGLALYNALNAILPNCDLLPNSNTDPDNLLANGMFVTGANGATSWSTYSPVPAFTQTQVARTDGVNGFWQEINITSSTMAIFQDVTTKFAVGDAVCGVLEFEVDSAATSINSFFLTVHFKNGATELGYTADLFISDSTVVRFGSGYIRKGIMKTSIGIIPVGTTSLNFSLDVNLVGKIRIANARMFKVLPYGQ